MPLWEGERELMMWWKVGGWEGGLMKAPWAFLSTLFFAYGSINNSMSIHSLSQLKFALYLADTKLSHVYLLLLSSLLFFVSVVLPVERKCHKERLKWLVMMV